ncbi:MAG: NAD(P)H-dependent oxidoreductase [Patescibacteria group bacterium]
MTSPLSIPVLLGTVRQGRQSEHIARYLHAKLVARGVRTTFVDPRNLTLPMTDEGEDLKVHNPDYVATITTADALLLVVPEYNRGYPGSLKRMLDICYDEYRNKPVGLVGVSSGIYGGTRALAALLPVLKILGLIAMRRDLNVGPVSTIFSEVDGKLLEPAFEKQADQFLDELLAFAKALQVLK